MSKYIVSVRVDIDIEAESREAAVEAVMSGKATIAHAVEEGAWLVESVKTDSPTMRGFRITKDYLDGGSEDSAVGTDADAWSDGTPLPEGPVVAFRLYDDDDNLYYAGVFGDGVDDRGDVQADAVLNWGTWYAGCTTVRVFRGGKWEQEIG